MSPLIAQSQAAASQSDNSSLEESIDEDQEPAVSAGLEDQEIWLLLINLAYNALLYGGRGNA